MNKKRQNRFTVYLVVHFPLLLIVFLGANFLALAQTRDPEAYRNLGKRFSEARDAARLAQPFVGITSNGEVQPGLFSVESTGVSTEPVAAAANAFLKTLNDEQKNRLLFSIEDDEWRKWGNQHVYLRQGLSFEEMNEEQREAGYALLRASMSADGFQLSRDIMRLNHTLAELNNDNFLEYGEYKYWLSIMGRPSTTEPWGWQLDGHHLILNYFVLGDQVVFTPAFWGSEPTVATAGKYAGISIMNKEQEAGLALIRSLSAEQKAQAVLQSPKTKNYNVAEAFNDNAVLDYTGISVSGFDEKQKQLLLDLIGLYVAKQRDPHQRPWMSEIESHLDETFFAWIGATDDDAVFYYRIHSPVLLIEFDHQAPVGLRHLYPPGVPFREHIHAVVRTPNGNDYGKDLLRQHYQQHPH